MADLWALTELLWTFLRTQPQGNYLAVLPWHLWAVLTVLAVLAAFGVHFIVGHVLRLYRGARGVARLRSVPMALVYLVSVLLLLGAYVAGTLGSGLVAQSLSRTQSPAQRLGELMLQPALEAMPPQDDPAGINRMALAEALGALSGEDYREALAGYRDPAALAAEGPGRPLEDHSRALVGVGLLWLSDPDQREPMLDEAPAPNEDETAQALFLPEFIDSLMDELGPEVSLPPEEWAYVAGTRFVNGVLRPEVQRYLAMAAIVVTALVVLVNLGLLYLLHRLRRASVRKAAALGARSGGAATAGRGATPPPARSTPAPTPPPAPPEPRPAPTMRDDGATTSAAGSEPLPSPPAAADEGPAAPPRFPVGDEPSADKGSADKGPASGPEASKPSGGLTGLGLFGASDKDDAGKDDARKGDDKEQETAAKPSSPPPKKPLWRRITGF